MASPAEFDLPWSGDFSLTPTGDILLAQDTDAAATATMQRLTRLVLTSPAATDGFGNAVSVADDMFHPNWGAGTRAAVGANFNAQNIQAIRTIVLNELAQDPGVALSPSPVVDVQLIDYKTAYLSVTIWTTSGQQVALPALPLTPSGA